jgi:tetratricopeptide (TPR) repeat protein
MIPSDESLKKAAYLLGRAERFQGEGQFRDAERLTAEARQLAIGNLQALAEIDLFHAVSLLKENRREEGVQRLCAMLVTYADLFKTPDGLEVYEALQLQRAFSLIHLEKKEEALPILEEALSFQLESEVESDLHCHLGRCYHELSKYSRAKEQFERADALGVGEDWQSVFHYYFGYTLYELRDFQRAKREFILCVQSSPDGPPESMRYAMLAATSRKLGEHSEARAYEEKAKSLTA